MKYLDASYQDIAAQFNLKPEGRTCPECKQFILTSMPFKHGDRIGLIEPEHNCGIGIRKCVMTWWKPGQQFVATLLVLDCPTMNRNRV